jgi:hypothetical protein
MVFEWHNFEPLFNPSISNSMQKLGLKTIVFCSLFFLCALAKLNAQSINEAVIGCPDISEKQIEEVEQQINAIAGLHVLGYAQTDQLFLVKFDTEVIADGDALATVIQNQFTGLRFFYKPHRSRKDVLTVILANR